MTRNIFDNATTLAAELTTISNQYTEGLVCPKEFIYKALDLVATVLNHMPNTECQMRIDQCGDCPAVKINGSPEHELIEKAHQTFINSL